jgi:ABC-type nitrate/sulfonate/bicarbonate transport system permease component
MTDTAAPATTRTVAAPARRRRRTPDLAWTAAIGVVALCYLQWGPRPESMSTRVVPDPASVAAALADAASGGALWPHLWSTLVATIGGFLVATVAAVFPLCS